MRSKTLYIFLFLAIFVLFVLSGCGLTSAQEKQRAKDTVNTYKQLYKNYVYLWDKLSAANKAKYKHLYNSFQELIRSGIIREYEFSDIKEFKDFLNFLNEGIKLQTQTKGK